MLKPAACSCKCNWTTDLVVNTDIEICGSELREAVQ